MIPFDEAPRGLVIWPPKHSAAKKPESPPRRRKTQKS